MADTKARGRARTTTTSPTPTWAQRTEALTHILTHPSHSPSLHSQLFLASRVPCPPQGSSYPPFLCPGASLLRWALTSVFLPRAARLGLPPSSWRSRCPFQLPPPLVPSTAIELAPERWGEAELRGYAKRRRARRGQMRARPPVSVAGVVLTTVPNVVIIAVIVRELFWEGPLKMAYRRGSNFEKTYRCYPASFIDRPQLEGGDKVIMPQSALHRLASMRIDYPMLFELHNSATGRISHCGVLEFVAEEGMIIMPYWMMQNMLLREGDILRVKNARLPKGTYVKLQPHTSDFLDISNPKVILEKTLRSFSCLTTGDSIMVAYNNKQYHIDIVEAKPASAVSIIETDCEVDFAPPLDYKEPEKPQPTVVPASKAPAEDQDADVEVEPKFKPFTGSGKRLDGKVSKQQAPEVSSAAAPARSAPSGLNKMPNQQTAAPSGASTSKRQITGKLVFGSGASNKKEAQSQKEPVKVSEPPKKEEPKFNAFTGKSYSLKN